MTIKYRNYHTTRHLSEHIQALDDFLYGSPDSSYKEDRALRDPDAYLNELDDELKIVQGVKEDVIYVLREFDDNIKIPVVDIPLDSNSKNHIFHILTARQFTYAEKIKYLLQDTPVEKIDLIYSKAVKQLHVLSAAEIDLKVAKYRFEEYMKIYK